MKKIIIFISVLWALSLQAFAAKVDFTEAQRVAGKFLGSQNVSYVWNGEDPGRFSGNWNPAFYVFNSSAGWVIVSAEDCAAPILMHGEGTFDPETIPDNMRSFLKDIEFNIKEAARTFTGSELMSRAWETAGEQRKAGAAEQVLLNTANWGQGNPYNLHCPMDGSSRSITGCVATAMAIVLRYNCWPDAGKGVIPAYETETKKINVESIDIDGYEYDWTKMPLASASDVTWTSEQKEAVSWLMAHCGAMVEMDYSSGSSGAYSSKIAPALIKHMSYFEGAREVYRSWLSNNDWFNILKAELDSNRPIIYGGSDLYSSSGHQFVCDGYNSNNEIHINWGWNGSNNAWYAVSYLDSKSAVYSRNDGAIIGLYPKKESDFTGRHLLLTRLVPEVTSGSIAPNTSFSYKVAFLISSNVLYKGSVAIALADANGNIKQFVSSKRSSSDGMKPGYYYTFTFSSCKITSDLAVGDRLVQVYQPEYETNPDKWEICPSGSVLYGATNPLDVAMLEIPSTVNAGYVYYPSIVFGHRRPDSFEGLKLDVNGTEVPCDNCCRLSGAGTYTFKLEITYGENDSEIIEKVVTVL